MTPERMCEVVAEYMGEKRCEHADNPDFQAIGCPKKVGVRDFCNRHCLDGYKDRTSDDAPRKWLMEVMKKLKALGEREEFVLILYKLVTSYGGFPDEMCDEDIWMLLSCATALQITEAIIRAIGRWED